jgi:hypothetical protein
MKPARVLIAAAGAALLTATIAPAAASAHQNRPSHRSDFSFGVLTPVPTNHVTGIGFATVVLRGDTARITIDATGLLRNAPHAMHIHVDGTGRCPGSNRATNHNGHRAISTSDAAPDYGSIGTSLTTSGDTSPASALAVDRFPQTGTFHYSRTITLSPDVVSNLRSGKAVVVVHGIDYNHNGRYDGVLGASELDPALPQEATAPALCGALR